MTGGDRSAVPVREFRAVPLAVLDSTAIARSLSQVADRAGDLADAYFERLEEVMIPPRGDSASPQVRLEQGFAVRLMRAGNSWLAARDEISSRPFREALRQVARALPVASYPAPSVVVPAPVPDFGMEALASFPEEVMKEILERHAGFPLRLTMRRHRRWLRVVGTQVAPEPEQEVYFSCAAELPWGRYGALLAELDEAAAMSVAEGLIGRFRARHAPPPPAGDRVVVLGSAAAAVLLHEAVSHALETDTLMLCGSAEAARGVEVGSALLNVLDDPSSAPFGVRRSTDDEGASVLRRWLVREGRVDQPLANLFAARDSPVLTPGAGRRGNRHVAPAPRSTHLELLPGELSTAQLMDDAEGGLYLPEATRGSLDPLSGRFSLHLPFGRRLRSGVPAEMVGPCRLRGAVSDILAAVTGVGAEARPAGAGWCAKGGVKMPVWATSPAIRLEGLRVEG